MSLDREWEKFTGGPDGGPASSRNVLRVTLNSKGDLYFNARAHQALGQPKAVAIYYNRNADSIAVEPAYPRFVENFPVIKKQNGWVVHAASFCRHYRIKIGTTERFIRPDITNEGQLILNLRQTVTVGGVQRKKQTAIP